MAANLTTALIALPLLALNLSAGGFFDGGASLDFRGELSKIEAAPAPFAAPGAVKEWTIMVFVNAKNDLERFGFRDMNEMEMVGSSDRVNVVTEFGVIEHYDPEDNVYVSSVKRYLMRRDSDPLNITSPVVERFGKRDMGDYRNLVDFGRWAKANYPARRYMLIVWNHGTGWMRSRGAKGISYDDETYNHITTPQLGLALREIGGVDVYGSDACLMQMAEVVYELRGQAEFIVGSEEAEPADGYTYNTFLAPVVARPEMSPAELAWTAVDSYSDHYQALGRDYTQSYIKTSAIPGFTAAADAFASALMRSGEKALARKAAEAAQKYAYPENKDLYDFAGLVVSGTGSPEVRAAGEKLRAWISGELVVYSRSSPGHSRSRGIAVYLPPRSAAPGYGNLQWARDSAWGRLIDWQTALP